MSEIVVGSAEWDALTKRRAELIVKKNRGGLDPAEAAEFERLQERSRGIIEKAFPIPTLVMELGTTFGRIEGGKS